MNATIYSQEAIFHLSRLGLLVSGITGKRYKLGTQQNQENLIEFCRGSTHPAVRMQLDAFLKTSGEQSTAKTRIAA